MEKVLSDLTLGTIAGLVATFFAVVISRLWKSLIEPWYEERVYKDARIEGPWRAKATINGIEREVMWDITQIGHRIRATAVPVSGPNKGKVFRNEGSFRNLILTLSYTRESRETLDRGCLAAKLVQNGTKLLGYIIHYNPRSESLEPVEYVMERVDRSDSQQSPGVGPNAEPSPGMSRDDS